MVCTDCIDDGMDIVVILEGIDDFQVVLADSDTVDVGITGIDLLGTDPLRMDTD